MSAHIRRVFDWLLPFALLVGAILVRVNGAGGIAATVRTYCVGVLERLLPAYVPATLIRPPFADQAELIFLAAAGLGIVFLFARGNLPGAGLVTAGAIVAAGVFAWRMVVDAGFFFDVFYPAAALIAVFLLGLVLALATAAEERARLRRALAAHLPPAVMTAVARRPELLRLPGEARTMSYLVCAIRGYGALTESYGRDAVGLSVLTRRVMSPLAKAILDRGGAIDRVMPGGLSAFFNAPLDDSEHAVHACECALRMTEELEHVNAALERERRSDGAPITPVEIGIGINTGSGVAGDFGTFTWPEYMVSGRAAEIAAEIEALSAKYGPAIIVGDATRRAAERNFAFLEVDLLAGAAAGESTPIFALLGNPLVRASPKFRALQTFHEHIFQAYRAREWDKTRALIEKCRALSGASPQLYDLYLARIAYLETHPPGETWNGVFRPQQT